MKFFIVFVVLFSCKSHIQQKNQTKAKKESQVDPGMVSNIQDVSSDLHKTISLINQNGKKIPLDSRDPDISKLSEKEIQAGILTLFDGKNYHVQREEVTHEVRDELDHMDHGLQGRLNLTAEGEAEGETVRRAFHFTMEPGIPNAAAAGIKGLLGRRFTHSAFLVIDVPKDLKDAELSLDPEKGLMIKNGDTLEPIKQYITRYYSWPELHNFESDFIQRLKDVQERLGHGDVIMEAAEVKEEMFDFDKINNGKSRNEGFDFYWNKQTGEDEPSLYEKSEGIEKKIATFDEFQNFTDHKDKFKPTLLEEIRLKRLKGDDRKNLIKDIYKRNNVNINDETKLDKITEIHLAKEKMTSKYNVFTFNCSHVSAEAMARSIKAESANGQKTQKALRGKRFPYELQRLLYERNLVKKDGFTQFRIQKDEKRAFKSTSTNKPSKQYVNRPYKILATAGLITLSGAAAADILFSPPGHELNLSLTQNLDQAISFEEAQTIDHLMLEVRALQIDFLEKNYLKVADDSEDS